MTYLAWWGQQPSHPFGGSVLGPNAAERLCIRILWEQVPGMLLSEKVHIWGPKSHFWNSVEVFALEVRKLCFGHLTFFVKESGSCSFMLVEVVKVRHFVGLKRWVLFEPHIPRHVVKGKNLKEKGEDDEAIHYFDYILPRIK